GTTARAARDPDNRRVPRVRADIARSEPAAHAAHERDERNPRCDPGGRHDRARSLRRRLHPDDRLRGRVLRGVERRRRLLGDEPDARHVPAPGPQGQEEEEV
ncbi:MAG: NAD(P) transhydrogenase alpha subunit, partial [uncultured Rubrobacteraceae bacterium]